MSAWPEAVWVAKKLKADIVNYQQYQSQLDNLNQLVIQLGTNVNGLIDNLNTIALKATTFIDEKTSSNSNIPKSTPQSNYGIGTIWLIES